VARAMGPLTRCDSVVVPAGAGVGRIGAPVVVGMRITGRGRAEAVACRGGGAKDEGRQGGSSSAALRSRRRVSGVPWAMGCDSQLQNG